MGKQWLRNIGRRCLRFLDGRMIYPVILVATIAILSIFGSIFASSSANLYRSIAARQENNWVDSTVESFRLDLKAGCYQLATQTALLSTIFLLAGFSISKVRWRRTTNFLGLAFLLYAIIVLVYTPFFI